MTKLYDLLNYKTTSSIGKNSWMGNLRWYAVETEKPFEFIFSTAPINERSGETTSDEIWGIIAARKLLGMIIKDFGEIEQFYYHADYIEAITSCFSLSLYFPWEVYGAIIELEPKGGHEEVAILFRDSLKCGRNPVEKYDIQSQNTKSEITLTDDNYTIVLKHNGIHCKLEDGMHEIKSISGSKILITTAFHMDASKAKATAEQLSLNAEAEIEKSRSHWEDYLRSCPMIEYNEGYTYHNDYLDKDITFSFEEIRKRQLWHWWCALVNVYHIEFNNYPYQVSPSKPNWAGVWSNDGPETLCVLSLTNQKQLARACLIWYIKQSINKQGILSWYTHASGEGCFGKNETGKYSHGVPNIVHSVDFYIRASGDQSILDEDAGDGFCVWDKIKFYIEKAFEIRDINGDGLIEWSNLWETGWDDKVGPFFSKVGLEEWTKEVYYASEDEIKAFYEQNSRPVTAISEQCYFLWALESMERLSKIKDDQETAIACKVKYNKIKATLKLRHWNEEKQFYFDWDVYSKCLSESKNLDAFYFMYFEDDISRLNALINHLQDKSEFNLMFTPTLSSDSIGFNPKGYWCGSYWPRESAYLGLALNRCGYEKKAEELVLKALCSREGNIIAETINPITGEDGYNRITKMAYCALLNVALIEIHGDKHW